MKIRLESDKNSNTSFTCDLCNRADFCSNNVTAESIGFINLPCGHTLCKEHVKELTKEEFRTKALESVKYELYSLEYSNFEDDEYTDYVGKEIRRYSAIYEDLAKIEDFDFFVKEYQYFMSTKYFKSQCPICNKKNKNFSNI
jgi:hypothetical protein